MRVTEQWRELIAGGKLPPDVHKTVFPEILKAEEDDDEVRRASFLVSSAAEDRDGDVIEPDGWELDAYRKNPVILWAHDARQLPIAKAESIEVRDGALRSTAVWPAKGVNPFADTVFDYVKGGFLRGASVGFHPLDAEPREDGKGVHFKRQELYEYSILPIPAHRDALAEAKAAGLDVAPIVKWAEELLDHAKATGEWVPRYQIEKAIRVVLPITVAVPAAPSSRAIDTGGHAAAGAGSDAEKEVRHEGDEWNVYSEDGELLGTHDNEEDALAQLAAIEANKQDDDEPKPDDEGEGKQDDDDTGDEGKPPEDDEGKQDDDEPAPDDEGKPPAEEDAPKLVAQIVEDDKREQEELEERWRLEWALTESLQSIAEHATEDQKRDLIRETIEQFVELYAPAREAEQLDDLAKQVFPEDEEPPADEPPPSIFGNEAVDAAMAALHEAVRGALEVADEQERAEALKAALEAFAEVAMGAKADEPEPEPEPDPEAEDALEEAAALLADEDDDDDDGKGLTADEVRSIVRRETRAAIDESRKAKAGRLPD